MSKSQYLSKAYDLLNDDNTYKVIRRDPTNVVQQKSNKIIQGLLHKEYIDKKQYKQLICHNGVSPRFYGLPKVHKNGTPLRPIISFVLFPFIIYQA